MKSVLGEWLESLGQCNPCIPNRDQGGQSKHPYTVVVTLTEPGSLRLLGFD